MQDMVDFCERWIARAKGADGVVFDAKAGQPYFYVFFDTKTKRIEKGGKFEWK